MKRGGTLRTSRQWRSGGDARLRDLFALGLVLAEILSPELARRERSAPGEWVDLPGELGRLARALASSAPAARPSASWAARRAAALLEERESPEAASLRRRAGVRRAYLSVRREDVLASARSERVDVVVPGQPGVWLGEALSLARALAELRGDAVVAGRAELGESTAYGRRRFLVTLIGPLAASWPDSAFADDGSLVERLLALAEQRELESLAFSDLASVTAPERGGSLAETDAVDLALALAGGAADSSVLDEVEARVDSGRASEALSLALARSLRRRGELGRALAVLDRTPGDAARADAAELSRREGGRERCGTRADRVARTAAAAEARGAPLPRQRGASGSRGRTRGRGPLEQTDSAAGARNAGARALVSG